MSEAFDRRSAPRLKARLESARTAGSWLPWLGFALALVLWGGILAFLLSKVGVAGILAQPPLALAGAFSAILAPGLALICAGVMARESRRSSETNALVMTAARMLLEPAENIRSDVSSMAQEIVSETDRVASVLEDTRMRVEALKNDIQTGVSAAMKAAEIVRADSEVLFSRMSGERQQLIELAATLREQAETLTTTIPLHARMLGEAGRKALEDIQSGDVRLNERVRELEQAGQLLNERILQMDNMGAESRKRAQSLASSLMRLDEQLTQSTKMVDSAVRAGELATAASKSTADALRDAVSDAIDRAMKASETITTRSASASEDARVAMERLREVGVQAETVTRAAALAAQSHANQTERRVQAIPIPAAPQHAVERPALEAPKTFSDPGLDRTRDKIERASHLLNQMRGNASEPQPQDRVFAADDTVLDLVTPAPPVRGDARIAKPKLTASADHDAITLNGGANLHTLHDGQNGHAQNGHGQNAHGQNGHAASNGHSAHAGQMRVSEPPPLAGSSPVDSLGLSWRDLLTGVEEVQAEPQDSAADTVLDRLGRAGVRLSAVKASDLRRIATAAHQGERQRRRAIRDLAPSEIQRVARLLDTDRDLHSAARSFVAGEEPEALRLLASADRIREDAAPRLSAYLYLDAALEVSL
jgi:hypothetical protein